MWKCLSVTGAMKKVGVLLEALCGCEGVVSYPLLLINCLSLFSTCITHIFTFAFAFALTSARNELTPIFSLWKPAYPFKCK